MHLSSCCTSVSSVDIHGVVCGPYHTSIFWPVLHLFKKQPLSLLIQCWRAMLMNWCCCRFSLMGCFSVERTTCIPMIPSPPSGHSLLKWATQPHQAMNPPPPCSPPCPLGASMHQGVPGALHYPALLLRSALPLHLVFDLNVCKCVWAACGSGWTLCAVLCGAVHAQK